MTDQEAAKEARARWLLGSIRMDAAKKHKKYQVGRLTIAFGQFYQLGSGTSWEAAFNDAERRSKQ